MTATLSTYTGSDRPTVVLGIAGNVHLGEVVCPRCLWSTRGARLLGLAEEEAAAHDVECNGRPPAGFAPAALERARAHLVSNGILDAVDWQTAAAYFETVKRPKITAPSADSRRWRADFPDLIEGDQDTWSLRLVLEVSHTRGVGYAAALMHREQLGNMTRFRMGDVTSVALLGTWAPRTGAGRPSPYSARRASEYGHLVLSELLGGSAERVRRVPGAFVEARARVGA